MQKYLIGLALLFCACSESTPKTPSDGSLSLKCEGQEAPGGSIYFYARFIDDAGSWSGPIGVGQALILGQDDFEKFDWTTRKGNEITAGLQQGRRSTLKIDRTDGKFDASIWNFECQPNPEGPAIEAENKTRVAKGLFPLPMPEPKCGNEIVSTIEGVCAVTKIPPPQRKF